MIKFKKVRWKNFLSTGNNFIEIQLDRSPTTLIVGENGAGKSTLLDALSFGLFGKAHRDINKIQLVNSINNKGALVEIEFEIGTHKFKIIRGMKPTIFEIWQNGKMINQAAASRDYQRFLEQNILKLNHKSFHQIVVLGSSSFIPFMQLPTGVRREVIEDLLDIQIFSKMNIIIKDRLSKIKNQISDVNYALELIEEKIKIQRKYIEDLTKLNENQIKDKRNEIEKINLEIEQLQKISSELSDYISNTQSIAESELDKNNKLKNKISEFNAQFKQQAISLSKETMFYEKNTTCPTCTQSINKELRDEKIESSKLKAEELSRAIQEAENKLNAIESEAQRFNKIINDITEKNIQINNNNKQISALNRKIQEIETDINSFGDADTNLSKTNAELKNLLKEKEDHKENKHSLIESRLYNEAAAEMLKDTGIKTKIIKEYLPVMNTLINKYLQVLDFFVSFNLDENFNEEIKSRYRDSFNYSSFSEGEKQRVDLALLFTWRQIARMKNSTSTNLLVLDETFDSSMDQEGLENLMKILGTIEDNTNVFVISHKGDLLDSKFRSKISFVKEHNFSQMLTSEK